MINMEEKENQIRKLMEVVYSVMNTEKETEETEVMDRLKLVEVMIERLKFVEVGIDKLQIIQKRIDQELMILRKEVMELIGDKKE
jgi:hypothetical protein